MLRVVTCRSCAGVATFISELQPFGSTLGHRVYFCDLPPLKWSSLKYVLTMEDEINGEEAAYS